MSDDDELIAAAGEAAARMIDMTEIPEVMAAQNAAGEAMAVWALELLRAGAEPLTVSGALGGAGASVALATCAEWANGALR